MAFFTGRSEDGSDAIQSGVYLSPDGKNWSSAPYTAEQKAHKKDEDLYWSIIEHLKKKYNENKGFQEKLLAEYNLVVEKKSDLNRKQRNWLINYFEY